MSDLIELERGRLPWRPTPNSKMIEVLHRYDHPLMGVLEVNGTAYLFECIVGVESPLSGWWYVMLAPSDLEDLDKLAGDDLRTWITELARTRRHVIALAVEGEGIAVTEIVEDSERYEEHIDHLFARLDTHRERIVAAQPDEDRLSRNLTATLATA